MNKKLGPLPAWQWLAIGAAVGVIYYIYKARQNHAATVAAPAQTTTDLGPIDPTTGQPYALEGAYQQGAGSAASGQNTQAQNAGPTNLQQELSDLGQIEALMAGATSLPTANTQPAGGTDLTAINQSLGLISARTQQIGSQETAQAKAQARLQKQLTALEHQVRKLTTKPKSNPGHTVTTHHNGKKTVSSTAPHNKQQHKNIAPPAHQRAHPTQHPSTPQRRPGVKVKPR